MLLTLARLLLQVCSTPILCYCLISVLPAVGLAQGFSTPPVESPGGGLKLHRCLGAHSERSRFHFLGTGRPGHWWVYFRVTQVGLSSNQIWEPISPQSQYQLVRHRTEHPVIFLNRLWRSSLCLLIVWGRYSVPRCDPLLSLDLSLTRFL